MSKKCPVCGSERLEHHLSADRLKGDLGKEAEYQKIFYKCPDCGSEGDFFDENSGSIETVLDELKKTYVTDILDNFTKNKVSFSSIERVLNLPQRTLTKWKNNASRPTAAGVALLKFLHLFPWLLDVAEHNFDYDVSQKVFIHTAFTVMLNKLSFSKTDIMTAGVSTTNTSSLLYFYAEKKGGAEFVQKHSSAVNFISSIPSALDDPITFGGDVYQ
jgi:transposase-like protein